MFSGEQKKMLQRGLDMLLASLARQAARTYSPLLEQAIAAEVEGVHKLKKLVEAAK